MTMKVIMFIQLLYSNNNIICCSVMYLLTSFLYIKSYKTSKDDEKVNYRKKQFYYDETSFCTGTFSSEMIR